MTADGARRPLIAGNWKMFKTASEAEKFVDAVLLKVSDATADVALCAPFTALPALVERVRGSPLAVFAQTMHEEDEGAFTGEVSASMLTDLGVAGVVLGHSERRQHFNETDRALALKVPAALDAGLVPIVCVGESEEERDAGDTQRKLRHQVQDDLSGIPDERLSDVVIAYERIWAMGPERWPPRSRPRRRSPSSAPWWAIAPASRRSGCASSTAAA